MFICAGDDEIDESENDSITRSSPLAEKGKGKAAAEYEDEEQLATVTIIDELDPDALHEAPPTFGDADDASGSSSEAPEMSRRLLDRSRKGAQSELPFQRVSNKGESARSNKKTSERQKKIAYETKAARRAARTKQRGRMKEKTTMTMAKQRRKTKRKGT